MSAPPTSSTSSTVARPRNCSAPFSSAAAGRRWPLNHSPLYLDFLAGNRDYRCTPWGNPTRNIFGWQRPCYLLGEGYASSFRELMEGTDWDSYGTGNYEKCADCMAHCGYEATAVDDLASRPWKILPLALSGIRTDGPMAPEIPLAGARPAQFVFKDFVERRAAALEAKAEGGSRPAQRRGVANGAHARNPRPAGRAPAGPPAACRVSISIRHARGRLPDGSAATRDGGRRRRAGSAITRMAIAGNPARDANPCDGMAFHVDRRRSRRPAERGLGRNVRHGAVRAGDRRPDRVERRCQRVVRGARPILRRFRICRPRGRRSRSR